MKARLYGGDLMNKDSAMFRPILRMLLQSAVAVITQRLLPIQERWFAGDRTNKANATYLLNWRMRQ
jgi:hypothetical protein